MGIKTIITMKLLKYENYQINPTEECFYVKEFRDLFNKDKSPTKEHFMSIMSILYFFADPRSPYQDILDQEERLDKIKVQEGLDKNFKIDAKLQKLINIYRELTTTTSQKLLDSMRKSVVKAGEYLEGLNLNETDDKGRLKTTISSYVQATAKIPILAKQLIETEKIVNAEIEQTTRIRGGEETAHVFEGGF